MTPARRAKPAEVAPAEPRLAPPPGFAGLQDRIGLGTSSWSFPGWAGLVWRDPASTAALAREGLAAYAAHPLLNAVGIDRGFYRPLEPAQYATYADAVPASFRFVVKAPGEVTDAVIRGAGGRGVEANPHHLDAGAARERFVAPCREGLGAKAGALVFQFPPLPRELLRDPPTWIARLGTFLDTVVPAAGDVPVAVELRDAPLLTPRLVGTLRDAGATLCIGLHARMPALARQLNALDALERGTPGPLVVRWSLRAGLDYEAGRARYAPFDRIVDPDPATRAGLAERALAVARAGRPALLIANNKAEGCAPRTIAAIADEIARRAQADAGGQVASDGSGARAAGGA